MMFRRARLHEAGWDGALQVDVEAEAPKAPVRDQVQIEVEACGVCHRDLIDRAGGFAFMRLPITPGHEAVGRVVAAGPAVDLWEPGDRVATMHRDWCGSCPACQVGDVSLCERAAAVLGLLLDGGYATHVTAPQRAFYRVPDELPAAHAATLHCTFGTAWRGLMRWGQLQAGQRVLVTGANGGVGHAAVQIASRAGAEVVATVRSADRVPFVEAAGATRVVVTDDPAQMSRQLPKQLGRWRAHLALDCVGAPTFMAALRSLNVGGRLVTIGNVSKEKVPVNLGYLITRGLQVIGSSGATPTDMAALLAFHAEHSLDFAIHAELPLDQAEDAQRMVRAGGLEGRIVLTCRT